jgi:hypothetical protein
LTQELIDQFKLVLESLEKERLKIIHDRKAFLFLVCLIAFLSFCCFVAGALGPSRLVLFFALVLVAASIALSAFRATLGRSFKKRFRDSFTRDWFRAAYPGTFLAPAPPRDQLPIEVSRGLREACIRATAQNPKLTSIEERIFFDSDSYQSWAFVLAERSLWSSRIRSRALVWFRAASDESPLVAFVWPPLGLSREPDIRFFMDGKPMAVTDPLKSKLVGVYNHLRSKAGGRAVRVSLSPTGVWAGVKLGASFFEPPLLTSVLDPASYKSWTQDASLPADREITRSLFTI